MRECLLVGSRAYELRTNKASSNRESAGWTCMFILLTSHELLENRGTWHSNECRRFDLHLFPATSWMEQPGCQWPYQVNADLRHAVPAVTARRCGGAAKAEHHSSSKSSDLVSHKENLHFMHLMLLTDCPICFRIQSEIVFLVFQTTPSLLGLFSSLSPGDRGALPFPSVCLFSPSSRLLAAEFRAVSSHLLLPRTDSLCVSWSHSPF